MHLAEAPAVLVLVGIVAYAVLGGADFGAGFWQLTPGIDARSRAIRGHAYHAMGPVWEANHVWLIFILVIAWTAYPVAFGSIASTLCVPLFIAAIGIILRGTAYALRQSTDTLRGQRRVEVVFALSSILTPFALGTVVGGIASGRVPVGNAAGDLVTSWLNPTSIVIGVTAVAAAAYLAAVYLAADAVRLGESELAEAFRKRALLAGFAAGAAAFAGLVVVRQDAERIWNGLTGGWGLVALAASAAGGVSTLLLVRGRRYGPARLTAAVAVAAIVAGWALAQRPILLPGLTIDEAAAGRTTLIAVLVAAAIGAVVLVPQLFLLFRLFLRGTFDVSRPAREQEAAEEAASGTPAVGRLGVLAVALGVVGVLLTMFSDSGWTLAIGVASLLAFVATGFVAIVIPAAQRLEPDGDVPTSTV